MENTEGLNIIMVLAFGTFALLIMAMAVIFFVVIHQRRVIAHQLTLKQREEEMQREMLRAIIQSQEAEQRRIARDLHDDLGPMLSAVKLKISMVKRMLDEKELDIVAIDESRSMLDVTINQVRNISHQLLPPLLEDYGLAASIESICNKMNTSALEVSSEVPAKYARLTLEAELALYRVVTELLNNALKHSGASKLTVRLEQTTQQTEISVIDNGQGFDINTPGKNAGLGLKNIRSRLAAISGDIHFDSNSGGTKVVMVLKAT